MRYNALCSLHDYFWQKADRYNVNITDVYTMTSRTEYQRHQVTMYNDSSNKAMALNSKIQKSARIAQQLTENIRPSRYEDIANELHAEWQLAGRY